MMMYSKVLKQSSVTLDASARACSGAARAAMLQRICRQLTPGCGTSGVRGGDDYFLTLGNWFSIRLHRGLNQNVAYGCLNDNQEEGTPASLFSLAPVAVPPLSPACEPG
ncbi:hypothetical protein JOQ06_014619 [Pogonophryne albipinna]|uniref:Uncharacterized protein n=1 Tax=Pogonophryne albipinna TaxID=1090488 RepID=A0AAD6AMA5_9TELE|nr:hypothetical protein JOQ06_014619 [Pogonophryne albipinna]